MAKITRMGNLSPGQVPLAPAGVVFRDTRYGLIAQAKPPKRLNRKKPYQFYREKEFGWAGRFAANPLAIDFETALEMVKGTQMVPRDFLTQCMYGRGYVIQGGPYTNWPNYRDVTNNPQYVLELLDPDVGAVIVRDPIGWVARPPGDEGYVLTMAGGLPQWRAGGGGGSSLKQWLQPPAQTSSTSTAGARCLRIAPRSDIVIDRLAIWYERTSAQNSKVRIFKGGGTTLGPMVFESAEITTPANTFADIEFAVSPAFTFESGKRYWIVQFSPGAGSSYRLNTYISTSIWMGFLQNEAVEGGTIATDNPVAGNTVSTTSNKLAMKFRQIG